MSAPSFLRDARFAAGAVLLGALLLALATTPAAANGGERGDIEFGPYAGVLSPDGYDGLDPDGGTFYGVRGGYWFTDHWSVEGSWQKFSTSGDIPGDDNVDLKSLRANGLYNFRAGKKFRWFLTAGLGSEKIEADGAGVSESSSSWNWGGGLRWHFGKKRTWGIRADGLWVTTDPGGDVDGTQTNFQTTGGLFWAFGGGAPEDTDHDGVPDKKDECAATPKGAKIDAKGCPIDTDGDRVYDGLDKCPGTQKGWAVEANGCPADKDGDGVADMVDKCPDTPKEIKVNEQGCPKEDADGDGVWDGADRCPNTEKGLKVDAVGCPIDADKDGVPDRISP
ncbi:MAG TPA: porin family protein [Dongiaceae bacterium]|nr:porin family protein [Dongiaceae bacterium]